VRNLRWTLLFFALLSSATFARSQTIKIKGSDTLQPLAERWAQVYGKKKPAIHLLISGGGSSVGISALLKGEIDIAESSRPVNDSEIEEFKKEGKTLVDFVVATDAVEILVNSTNPVSSLTMEQVKGIFTGTITNWKEVGGADIRVNAYGRDSSSGTHAFMQEHALKGNKYVSSIREFSSNAPMVAAVMQDPGGIAYAGLAASKNAKHLPVQGAPGSPSIEPSVQNVAAGKYPLSRQLHWYLAARPVGDVKDLCEWVISQEAQTIVQTLGFLPLTSEARTAARSHL
jgi:phosphate transport system substrate-binding protein